MAVEHLNLQVRKDPHFPDLLKAISDPPSNKVLTNSQEMLKLNRVRNNLKHASIQPTRSDVEDLRLATTSFLETNCKALLGVDFGKVSMRHLIEDADVRKWLEDGESREAKGELHEAACSVAIAFRKVLLNFHKREWGGNDVDPYSFGDYIKMTDIPNISDGRVMGFFYKLENAIGKLQDGMEVLALGLNYNDYARFRFLFPIPSTVLASKPDEYTFTLRSSAPRMNPETLRWGVDFAIRCALHVQELPSYRLASPSPPTSP